MNPADKAIEEIRAVRHRISGAHGHDVGKYLAYLRAEESLHAAQLERGRELLVRRQAESGECPMPALGAMVLREHTETRKVR